ncbi:hypothetical protein [Syntrophomonas wolfei]|uniref:Uncharacterized protein n=1 Tax=Syntrophomonas wolfei subsp. wolfei (strain DSM 2245B / Goettingen) TaxID=335541 RepID=Q0AZ16_SYNWW|nr:hypothetical protein [Syntrophomonas wolfei]ABI68038.1 conserved hypothetical protein [Syntrophomonas wolfei subsp. wolfei str. Goettingen G311]
MRKISNLSRTEKLIKNAINLFELDLKGISVLTETASGPFVTTCLIAAVAGADQVFAVTRDSRYGKAQEVIEYTMRLAKFLNIQNRITISDDDSSKYARYANIVTNLGFVRPINKTLIELLPRDSAISLMWEPWEFRQEDVDLEACKQKGIPVLGTCETHPQLLIFRYVGMLALKLLLEEDIEVFRSTILVVGSGHFGIEIMKVMQANEAKAILFDPLQDEISYELKGFISQCDAIVIAEHKARFSVIGGETGIPVNWIHSSTTIIHICGEIDYISLEENEILKMPPRKVMPGFMTVTTDYVGPRPVIDLHTAGLKVGEEMVRGMRVTGDYEQAIQYALKNSLVMDF